MPKLLITGASGFLGWHLCQQAQPHWQVYGTYHANVLDLPGVTTVPVDLTDSRSLQTLFQTIQPDAVIHAAALSQPNACQENPELSHQINVTASWEIADLCANAKIPCLFTSSELVFDGRNPPYQESDPVCPINLYGEQKAAAEAGMLDRYPDITIARMPLMFGAVAHAQSFIQPFIARIRSGQTLNLFTDEIRTPVSGRSAAAGVLLALQQAKGRIHLGGRERLSRYEMGLLLVEVLKISNAKLNPCKQADVPMPAPRAPDVSMDSSRAFELGYQPGLMRDELAAIAAEL
ncbi:MAG: SDR family oxidoreductase [Elainellaceae cyanobacterium]